MISGLVSIRKAAEILSISRSKLYNLLYHGAIPSILIGRARRIDMDDLENFIGLLKREAEYGKKPTTRHLQAKGRGQFVDQLRREAGIGGEP